MTSEIVIRLSAFLAILLAMAVWETHLPKRPWKSRRGRRWIHHLAISTLNVSLVRVVVPLSIVMWGIHLETQGFGLLNWLDLPAWLAVIVTIIALDLVVYAQHVMFHKVPLFWRFHLMHHTDLDFDVTTGFRFHPIEILISMVIKFAAVAVIGAPAIAIVIFEIVLNATSMFNHGNVQLPRVIDRYLRWFVVTPDMHRVHHSVTRYETDSNFGFNLPIWDRLFGTYRDQPEHGHSGMSIGLPVFRKIDEVRIDRLISQPFRYTRTTK